MKRENTIRIILWIVFFAMVAFVHLGCDCSKKNNDSNVKGLIGVIINLRQHAKKGGCIFKR